VKTRHLEHIALRKKIAYSAPAFALAVVGIPVYVYIPKFYTDVVGINIAVLGTILFSVRIFDAVTDPAIGYISDRTQTRFGRRRPYIAIASLFVVLSMVMLFNPPQASAYFETWWFGICIYALFLFWTLVVVPFESLGPEITFDYHERTSLFGMRDGFLIAGTLMAASSPAVVQWAFDLTSDAEGERAKFFWIAVVYAPLLIGSCWWCVLAIKERTSGKVLNPTGVLMGFCYVARNRPFIILVISYTIASIGSNLPATLILYYVEYVLQSHLADAFLLLYFVSGIIFLPGWILLSRRIGKKAAWLTSMAINTGAFIGVFFLGPGDMHIYGILVFISGIGFGATLALPSAIQADVIDYDELLSGQRREGQYIGLWSITKKFAAAIGVGAGLSILGLAGYTPNVAQTEQVQLTLRTLYALVPSVCNIIAFIIILAYPISSRVHEQIRNAIAERKVGNPVTDPLKPDRMIS
jgi:GPH family glycoside/pentoside/hexuronide:cation symporter